MNRAPAGVWLIVIAACLPAAVRGQPPADGVLFLDFLASDREGQPVAGLTASDVTLKVGGKVRPLLSLEFVAAADRARDIVLLLDESTLYGLEPLVREAVSALLESVPPGDRVSSLSTRRAAQLNHQPDHAAVRASLEAMHTGPGDLWTCVPDMLRVVENLARLLPPGRTSTIVVLTRGVLPEDSDPLTGRSVGCAVGREDLRQTQQALASTQISVHLIAVNHLTRSWGLDTVTENTGGSAGLLTWKDPGALVRLLDATRPFYRATLAADTTARQPQRVEISTNRRGVRITTAPSLDLRLPKP